MNRRTTSSAKTDDAAFPVRINIAVPRLGLGRRLHDVEQWLRDDAGRGNFACHSSYGVGTDAMAVHLRSVGCALAFLHAFPDLDLADGIFARQKAPYGSTAS